MELTKWALSANWWQLAWQWVMALPQWAHWVIIGLAVFLVLFGVLAVLIVVSRRSKRKQKTWAEDKAKEILRKEESQQKAAAPRPKVAAVASEAERDEKRKAKEEHEKTERERGREQEAFSAWKQSFATKEYVVQDVSSSSPRKNSGSTAPVAQENGLAPEGSAAPEGGGLVPTTGAGQGFDMLGVVTTLSERYTQGLEILVNELANQRRSMMEELDKSRRAKEDEFQKVQETRDAEIGRLMHFMERVAGGSGRTESPQEPVVVQTPKEEPKVVVKEVIKEVVKDTEKDRKIDYLEREIEEIKRVAASAWKTHKPVSSGVGQPPPATAVAAATVAATAAAEAGTSVQFVQEGAVVVNPTDMTREELYDELSSEQREYYDNLKGYALSLDETRLTSTKSYENVHIGLSSIVKLSIRKDMVVARFSIESELLKRYRRENRGNAERAKVKAQTTDIYMNDEAAYKTAMDLVTMSYQNIQESRNRR